MQLVWSERIEAGLNSLVIGRSSWADRSLRSKELEGRKLPAFRAPQKMHKVGTGRGLSKHQTGAMIY